jgi:hypothetical protein
MPIKNSTKARVELTLKALRDVILLEQQSVFTRYEFFLPRFDFGLLSRGHRAHYTVPDRIQLWFDTKIMSYRFIHSALSFQLRNLNKGLKED